MKLQSFLNVFEGEQLSYTSVFDEPTLQAVERFQNKYFTDILEPWGHDAPTGFVYILTKKKVNEIYCNALFPVSLLEQSEINSFRAYIEDLKGYMTDSLYSWFLEQKAKQPERKGFLTAVTEIAGSEKTSFTASRSRFELLTRVSEASASGAQTYEQKVEAELVKDGNDWKVNGIFWGARQ